MISLLAGLQGIPKELYYHQMYSCNPFDDAHRAGPEYKQEPTEEEWGKPGPNWNEGITGWGHARSKDLVHWEHLPMSIYPSEELGEYFCWFGSTTIRKGGTPICFYTSIGKTCGPIAGTTQWAATGSPDLINWEKIPGNPVMPREINKDNILRWCDPHVFICEGRTYRLSCVFAIDYSMASRTMLFDAVHRRYASSLLDLFDIDASLLSKPYAAGSTVGTLKWDVAEKLHISAAAKVVLGTHDHICNAIGSGVIETGWCSNTCGTTEGLSAITPMPESSAVIEQNGISFEPFDDQPHYITVAWSNTSGAMYRWLTELLAAEDSGCLARWTEELSARPDEISRLLVLPYFAGAATPYMDARAKGAICGLTLDTKPAEIFGAMVEASCFEMKRILAALEQAGVAPEHIVSTGAAATPFVSERKAAILGKPVQLVGSRQTGTLGGAMLGMLSEGEYASLTEAAGICVEKGRLYTADPALSARYHDRYQLYSQLYTQLKQINHGLL